MSDQDPIIPIPTYYQLKAELDVSFRRYVKEMADEIVKRIDRSETERREERRELEQRVRDLELRERELSQSMPTDLVDQLRVLHEHGAANRTIFKLLITVFGFALTIIGLGVTIISIVT